MIRNNLNFQVETNEGSYDLKADVRIIGKDVLIAIWGGEKPHIGAVAISQSRPSLKDPKHTSSSTSVICVLGHKEDDISKAVSEALSSTLKTSVVVTAGMHWDNISEEGIRKVILNSEILVDLILKRLKG